MSGVVRGSPLVRPVVVSRSTDDPSFQIMAYLTVRLVVAADVLSSVQLRCVFIVMVPPYLRCGTFHACETRDDRDVIHLCAVSDVVLEPGRPVGARVQPGERVGPGSGERRGRDRGVGRLAAERVDDPAGAVRVVERERALEAGADDRDVAVLAARAASATRRRLSSEPSSTTSHSEAAVRIAPVPFVVVRMSVRAFGGPANSRGDAPTSKPSTTIAFRSPPTTASSPSSARSARASSISAQQSTRS